MGFGFKELFHFSFPLISGHSPFIFLVYSSPTVPALCGPSELSADLAGRWDTGMISHLMFFIPAPQASPIHPCGVSEWDKSLWSGLWGSVCLGWWIPGCGHRTGRGCISSRDLRAALDDVHIKKRNVFSPLVILQNISHLTAFRSWLSWAFWGTVHWLLTGCSLLQSFLMETENLLFEETWKVLCK